MMAGFPIFAIGLAIVVGGAIGLVAYLFYKGAELP
jgi:hypothetical protein